MELCVVAIYDSALGAYSRPAFVPSLRVAVRGFQDEVSRPDGEMAKHPEDYALFELGAFEDTQGRFKLHEFPQMVLKASAIAEGKGK